MRINSHTSSQNSNQSNYYSPISTSSKDSQPSPLNLLRKASSVYIHKPASNNFSNNEESRKKVGSSTNRSFISNSQYLTFDDASVLSVGLKNLQQKQQERQYSGVKSLRIIASIDDAKSNQSLLQPASNESCGKDKMDKPLVLAPVKKDNYTFRDFLMEQNETGANAEKRNLSLIERLERQKETTNLLLEKSISKHSQMILANQQNYATKPQDQVDNLNIYFSTIKN
ncbi:hypothetical protein BpHYR1_044948 [Brachionus plicatilis]|uniref:Uncharacterized protein n=1 Tax=Brachionus plicatilis TaxID=10195 RepID=A0A3M7S0R3_BRAPC|nr:hypothetical protein BpHYR1_044948 [Brachionus plicatilis]